MDDWYPDLPRSTKTFLSIMNATNDFESAVSFIEDERLREWICFAVGQIAYRCIENGIEEEFGKQSERVSQKIKTGMSKSERAEKYKNKINEYLDANPERPVNLSDMAKNNNY